MLKNMTMSIISVPAAELEAYHQNCTEFAVFFSMKNCHWCLKTRPVIAAAVQAASIPVVEVVYEDNKEFVSKQNVRGFPEIRKYTKGGQITSFNGERTKEALRTFLTRSK